MHSSVAANVFSDVGSVVLMYTTITRSNSQYADQINICVCQPGAVSCQLGYAMCTVLCTLGVMFYSPSA